MPGAASPSAPPGAPAAKGGAAGLTALGGFRGLGNPNPPPGGSGRTSAPGSAGTACSPGPAAGGAPSCATAGTRVAAMASTGSNSSKPKCHRRNALPARALRGFIRPQCITLVTLGIVVVLVRTEMFARQRVALIQ